MCDGSLFAIATREAKIGDALEVRRFGEYRVSAFSVVGSTDECATCLRQGHKVRLMGLPANIQEEFGVGAIADATFVERAANVAVDGYDGFRFKTDGPVLPLIALGSGTRLNVVAVRAEVAAEVPVHAETIVGMTDAPPAAAHAVLGVLALATDLVGRRRASRPHRRLMQAAVIQ